MHIQSFINGVFVGFLLGILYAPDRGEETRRKISQRASDIKDTVKGTYSEVAGTVSSKIDQVKNKASQLVNKEKRNYSDLEAQTGNIENRGIEAVILNSLI